jgi:nucleoid DNA-binding protein
MYKVTVQNPCSCFIKKGLADVESFDTKEKAKAKAESLINTMRTTFCQKHEFDMIEQFGSFNIVIKPRR